MKREIKFRYIIQDGDAIKKIFVTIEETEKGFGISPDIKIIARSQYTGIKDKNGEEIYEGDIIESIPYESKEKCLSLVEWQNDKAKFYGTPHYKGEWIRKNKGIPRPAEQFGSFEVIGNVYDNENLLIFNE